MKLSQICLLLAACFIAFSCRETLGEQHRNSQQEQTAPSPKNQEPKTTVPETQPPIRKKQDLQRPATKKKERKQDTLKPKRAIP